MEKECIPICAILWGTRKVKRSLSLNTPNFPKPFKVSYFTHELKGGADNEGLWKGEALHPH